MVANTPLKRVGRMKAPSLERDDLLILVTGRSGQCGHFSNSQVKNRPATSSWRLFLIFIVDRWAGQCVLSRNKHNHGCILMRTSQAGEMLVWLCITLRALRSWPARQIPLQDARKRSSWFLEKSVPASQARERVAHAGAEGRKQRDALKH